MVQRILLQSRTKLPKRVLVERERGRDCGRSIQCVRNFVCNVRAALQVVAKPINIFAQVCHRKRNDTSTASRYQMSEYSAFTRSHGLGLCLLIPICLAWSENWRFRQESCHFTSQASRRRIAANFRSQLVVGTAVADVTKESA